jgi:endonuclease-3
VTEGLLQHRLGNGEPWRVVAISMLLCKTRAVVVEPIAAELFRRWGSPAALARANEAELMELIRPLGFMRLRAKRLREVGASFAAEPRPPTVATLPGCGSYVEDAYRMIVLGDLSVEPEDRSLAAWKRAVVR